MISCLLPGFPGKDFRVVQVIGERPDYYKKYGLAGHNGYDIAPAKPGMTGVVVYAPHNGYIIVKDTGAYGYGLHVIIRSLPYNNDGECFFSTLGHFASLQVKDGQYIGERDALGIMGKSGDADGIHVHWTPKKLDKNGMVEQANNGFGGALPLGLYAGLWMAGAMIPS